MNNNKLLISGLSALALTMATSVAHADRGHDEGHDSASIHYSGPADVTKVSDLPSLGGWFADDRVIIEGKLIKQVDQETFLFDDGSGEVLVEFDDEAPTLALNATDVVRVFGRYDRFWGRASVEAETIKVLKP